MATFTLDVNAVKLLVVSLFVDASSSLQIRIHFNDLNFPSDSVYPLNFTIENAQSGIVSLVSYIRPSVVGMFSYFITVEGMSGSDYTIDYANGFNSFLVVSSTDVPPPPTLISAVFSEDASYLIITFDSPTNRGDTATSFLCNDLLQFPCANISQCQWINSMTIHAYIDGSSPRCVVPGDPLHVTETASIKAQCKAVNNNCSSYSSWSNASNSSVAVLGPSSIIRPVPVISCPSQVGSCDNLTIDLSASKGNGGRYWTSISIHTSISFASYHLTALEHFLSSMTEFFPPMPIPHFLLEKNRSYEFTVRLCNFLAICGESSVTVRILNDTIPLITLPGNAIRSICRNTILTVISAVSVTPCGYNMHFSGVLEYEWRVYDNSAKMVSAVSISKDRTKLILPPFSLAANVTYTVAVVVSVRGSMPRQSSSAAIEVNVVVGNIRAVINGGLKKNMGVLTSMDIDGSESYDEDQSAVTGYDAGLEFLWSCTQTYPSFESACRTNLSMTILGSLVRIYAAEFFAGNIYQVTLLVTSVVDSRSSILTATVAVQSALNVIVNAIPNYSPTTKINPGQSIQFNGIITLPTSISNVTARWTVDDPSITLSQIASTSVEYRLYSSSSMNYLALSPNTLLGGYTLTFTLSCLSLLNVLTASSSVSLIINSSPKPGKFSVSPSSGTELKDIFLFNTELWMDVDLPLYYQFEYLSSTESIIVLHSRSIVSFGRSQLPAGLDFTNNELITTAQIFDELNANTSASFIVTVYRGPAFTLTEMNKFVSSTANQSLYSIDEIKQLTALSLYLMNSVNCSLAPNCSALNRRNCASTTNTCGGCKSKAYIGDSFDSNSPCFLPVVTLNSFNCSSSFDCIFPLICVNQTCLFPSKNCSNQCYGHGACVFKDLNTGLSISDCRVDNEKCASKCNCDDDHSGSQWCNLRNDELDLKKAMRKQAIDNVNYLISQEFPDQFAIPGWISVLVDATKSSDELNDKTMLNVLKTANEIVQLTFQSATTNDLLENLFPAVNSAASYSANIPPDTILDTNTVLNHTMSTLMSITTALSDSLVPGQDPIQSSQSCFQTTVVKFSPYLENQSMLEVNLPQSQSESLLNITTSSLALSMRSNRTALLLPIVVSIVSLRSTFYQNGTIFKANPLTVHMSQSPCDRSINSSCSFEFHLINSRFVQDGNYSMTNGIEIHCRMGVYEEKKYSCPNGHVVDAICNGTHSGAIVYQCPLVGVTTTCATLLGHQLSDLTDSVCHLTKHSADYSVCSCDINDAIRHNSYNFHRRKLSSSTGNSSQAVELSVTTLLKSVLQDSKSTIFSATSLNESQIQKEWTVLVTISTIVVVVAACMALGHRYDLQDKNDLDKRHKGKFSFKLKDGKMSHKGLRQTTIVNNNAPEEELTLLEESLPRVLGHQPFADRFISEVKQHHRWLRVAFFYSDSFPRSLRVLSLTTNVIVMLFVQSITYNLTKPDDGSCGTLFKTETACLEPHSSLGTGAHKCDWVDGQCVFVEQATSFTVVLFVAILSAIVSTPIAYVQDYLIFEYVAARPPPPPLPRCNDVPATNLKHSETSWVSIFPSRSFKVADSGGDGKESIHCTARRKLKELSASMKEYRRCLTTLQLAEFDRK